LFKRTRYQHGSVEREERKKGADVWVYRWSLVNSQVLSSIFFTLKSQIALDTQNLWRKVVILGAGVCTVMAKHAPPELLGIHTNFPGTIPSDIARALLCGDPPPSGLSPDESRAYEQLTSLFTKKRAYAQMMATRPQTLYGLADSPVCLAACDL
jgi:hypothetical protein